MPELHAAAELSHPRLGVRAAVGEPVAVKLKVYKLRIGVRQQNIIGAQTGLHGQQLHIVVVVEQGHALPFQRLAGLVQAVGQLGTRFFIGVIKTVHAGDDHFIGAIAFRLLDDRVRLPLERAQIGVETDYLNAALLQ